MGKPRLKELLNDWFSIPAYLPRTEKANRKSLIWGQLHRYVREQAFEILAKEISLLITRQECDVLLSVGMRGRLWEVVIRRRSQISEDGLPTRTEFWQRAGLGQLSGSQ